MYIHTYKHIICDLGRIQNIRDYKKKIDELWQLMLVNTDRCGEGSQERAGEDFGSSKNIGWPVLKTGTNEIK